MTTEKYISTLLALRELIDGALAEAGHIVDAPALPAPAPLTSAALREATCAVLVAARDRGLSWPEMIVIVTSHPDWAAAGYKRNVDSDSLREMLSGRGLKNPTKWAIIIKALSEHLEKGGAA